MKQLAVLLCLGILALTIVACGSDTPEPANTSAPVATTQPTIPPTEVPAATSAPTAAPTPVPTPQPVPTNTPAPEEPTSAPEPTDAPDPTSTPEPTATEAPESTATPEPTSTPEPTATTEPTPAPELPIARDLAPLGDNLLWVAYFDNRTKQWSVYDHSGTFAPDKLPLPPGETVPEASDVGPLTELAVKNIYWIALNEAQTVQVGSQNQTFSAGANFIAWK